MAYLKTILIAVVVTIITFFGVYNYQEKKVGLVSLTDISGTNNLSAYPTVQNANNTTLENVLNSVIGTTSITTLTTASSLATVGTITSGTWNATDIAVADGGTGRSTLTSGGALYGLGTSAVGMTAACSDSQVLMWTGGVPGCGSSAVDQTANYNWTGTNRFKTLVSSTTLTFSQSGAGYTWILPSTAMTASTTLKFVNTSGNAVYEREDWAIIASTTVPSAVASTTLSFLYTGSTQLCFYIDQATITGTPVISIQFNGDTGNNYGYKSASNNSTSFTTAFSKNVIILAGTGATNVGYNSEFCVNNVPDRTKEFSFTSIEKAATAASAPVIIEGTAIWANTSGRITSITVGSSGNLQPGTRITVMGSRN